MNETLENKEPKIEKSKEGGKEEHPLDFEQQVNKTASRALEARNNFQKESAVGNEARLDDQAKGEIGELNKALSGEEESLFSRLCEKMKKISAVGTAVLALYSSEELPNAQAAAAETFFSSDRKLSEPIGEINSERSHTEQHLSNYPYLDKEVVEGITHIKSLERKERKKERTRNPEGEASKSEKIKNEFMKHVGSEAYLQKLTLETGGNVDRARKIQKERLENLDNCEVYYVKKGEDNVLEIRKKPENFGKKADKDSIEEIFGQAYNAAVDINPALFHEKQPGTFRAELNDIFINQGSPEERSILHHELSHSSTQENKGISEDIKNKLVNECSVEGMERIYNSSIEAFKAYFNGDIKKAIEYFSDPTEILARKQALDLEMEKLGIKKYEEEFTMEHYEKLKEFFESGKLSEGSEQFMQIIKPGFFHFKKIFNEIAKISSDSAVAKNENNDALS